MYEDLTVEDIKNDILSRLSTDIDTREGSFINDMISAVAYEIWKAYQSLNAIIPIAFVDETSGEYIDKRCADYGIKRKEGTKAKVILTLIGSDGTTVPKGKVFLTQDGLQFETDEDVTITNGTATVTATAVEIGSEYNVEIGTITQQLVSLSGLTSVTNLEPAMGGTDPETDAALVKRLYDYLQKPATSGNAAHYRQWALEVPGCGDAKVIPLWDGPGTVKVVIVDSNKNPATEDLINNVFEHIEGERPIGASVTVVSAIAKSIKITAKVSLADGYTIQSVLHKFKEALEKYRKDIAFIDSYVSYAAIGNILFTTEGVLDYTDLKLSGEMKNIAIGEEEIPVFSVELEVM